MKRLLVTCIGVMLLVILGWRIHKVQKSEALMIYVEPTAHVHHFAQEQLATFSVDLYANHPEILYFHDDILLALTLTSTIGDAQLSLELKQHDVSLLAGEDAPTYRHRLHLMVPTQGGTRWYFEDAVLNFTFIKERSLTIPLGSVWLSWETSDEAFTIHALHPYINRVDDQADVRGAYVWLENPSPYQQCVMHVSPGDPALHATWFLTDTSYDRVQPAQHYQPRSDACLKPYERTGLLVHWEDERLWRRFPLWLHLHDPLTLQTMIIPTFTYQERYVTPKETQRQYLEVSYGD